MINRPELFQKKAIHLRSFKKQHPEEKCEFEIHEGGGAELDAAVAAGAGFPDATIASGPSA